MQGAEDAPLRETHTAVPLSGLPAGKSCGLLLYCPGFGAACEVRWRL